MTVKKKKKKQGDNEGIVFRAEEKAIFSLGAALHSNHTSASNTARPIKCIHQKSTAVFLIKCKQWRTAFSKINIGNVNGSPSRRLIEQSLSWSSLKLQVSKFGINHWHDVSGGQATFNGNLMKKTLLVPFLCVRIDEQVLKKKLVGDNTDRLHHHWLLVLCVPTQWCLCQTAKRIQNNRL